MTAEIARSQHQALPTTTAWMKVTQVLTFLVGALIPAISLQPDADAVSFLNRITPADIMTVFLVLLFVVFNLKAFRIHPSGLFYFAALLIGTIMGVLMAASPAELERNLEASFALFMAFCYWLAGYNVAQHEPLLRTLLSGVMTGILWESVVVIHDWLNIGNQWFPDPRVGRVRGTMRYSGQLGAFGFAVGGFLLTLGMRIAQSRWVRTLVFITGVLGIFFIFAAIRRSGIFALAAWGVLFLILGIPFFRAKQFLVLLVIIVFGLGIISTEIDHLTDSLIVVRLQDAITVLVSGDSFTQQQVSAALNNIESWVPFGIGHGRGKFVDPVHRLEQHSTHLSLLVESGLMAYLCFCWMIWAAIQQNWGSTEDKHIPLTKIALVTFLVIAFGMMMGHNRLHRERMFMLMLGVACSYAPVLNGSGNQTAQASLEQSSKTLDSSAGNTL